MSDKGPFEFKFPEVGPRSLVRLAEDVLRTYSVLPQQDFGSADRKYVSSVSDLISLGGTSITNLSSEEAAALVETFRQAVSTLRFPARSRYSLRLWFRLYTHALLLESRIFPHVELCDESPDHTPFGFADIWKGYCNGEPVCIKVIWTRDPARLREIESSFRRDINERRHFSHPNVLPIIDVSKMPFPFYIMSPWMPDGNITQHIQRNPDANRLTLLAQACQGLMHLHGLGVLHGGITPGNILITWDGQACLADFGITGAFRGFTYHDYKLETLRYMAPERFPPRDLPGETIEGPLEESDVYSLAMTSFEVLTGVLPYGGSDKADVVECIRCNKRPSRPADPSQNQRLQDRVWDTITACWSEKLYQRRGLFTMHRVFSVFSCRDLLVELPPVGRKNLIRLAEDLQYTFLHLHPSSIAASGLRTIQKYISDVVSRDGASPMILPSAKAAELTEMFNDAISWLPFPLQPPLFLLWLRLYTHALLLDSQIFPSVELCDEYLGYTPSGTTDTWKGNRHGTPACIKVIRTQDLTCMNKIKGTFHHKINQSRYISHPNLLPVIEISETRLPFCILSPWMPGGNIIQYTRMNPGADRLMLLAQACQGLMYLHGLGVLHGGIAPGNILITQDGQACLGDFGIISAFKDLTYHDYKLETIRYMAPERLSRVPTINSPSKQSDVYSLATTSFEILTGILPYDSGDKANVIDDIRSGKRPPRPTDPSRHQLLQDRIWDMIATCWIDQPAHRYELPVVYQVFSSLSPQSPKSDKPGPQQRVKFIPRIASLFQFLRDSEPEIEKLINDMDKRLENATLPDRERLTLLNKLCKTCSRHRTIPKSMHIPDCSKGAVEVECGGFADVSQSIYQGRRVAIKVVRVYITSDLDVILSRFCREGVAWKHLRHPNILPLLGVTVSEHRFAMVSEWMEHGNIIEFVGKDKHVNRTELLVDVANGLTYMHGLRMVHGDLKGANILINRDRRACLADFGLSTIAGVATHAAAGGSRASLISNDTLMSFTAGGTRRWMSPELLDPERFGIPQSEGDRPTRQSDCYALGMVIYEVLCGHHPYIEIQSDLMVVNEIMEGVRPEKPEGAKRLGFSDELWRTVELCWQEDRNARPRVEEILSCLSDATAFWYIGGFYS